MTLDFLESSISHVEIRMIASFHLISFLHVFLTWFIQLHIKSVKCTQQMQTYDQPKCRVILKKLGSEFSVDPRGTWAWKETKTRAAPFTKTLCWFDNGWASIVCRDIPLHSSCDCFQSNLLIIWSCLLDIYSPFTKTLCWFHNGWAPRRYNHFFVRIYLHSLFLYQTFWLSDHVCLIFIAMHWGWLQLFLFWSQRLDFVGGHQHLINLRLTVHLSLWYWIRRTKVLVMRILHSKHQGLFC